MSQGIQNFQLAWWGSQVADDVPAQIVKTLTNKDPDLNQKSPVQSMAAGTTKSLAIRAQMTPGRLDVFVQASVQTPMVTSIPLMASLSEPVDLVKPHLPAVSALIGDVRRLAFVCSQFEEFRSVEDAFKATASRAPVNIPFCDGSDFILQVNRKKMSAVQAGLELNRVLKWSSERIVFQMNDLLGLSTREFHASSFQVDINTVPDPRGNPYSAAEQETIFSDLISIGEQLLATHDIASLN